MSTNDDRRDADRIEDDIARTRAEVSSTIDAIQSRLTPGQMMDQAITYLRDSGTGEFGSNLGRTVRDHPVPVALIGVGIAWLALGGGRPPRALGAWSDTEAGLDEPGLASRVASAGSEAGERARATVSDAARRARDRMGDLRGRAASMQGATREQFDHARDRTLRMIDEQPLVLGAIGVAIGAAIGAALPRTRGEDAWMGDTRDGLLEGAADTARTSLHGVVDSAREVVRTAREEVVRAVDSGTPAPTAPGPTARAS